MYYIAHDNDAVKKEKHAHTSSMRDAKKNKKYQAKHQLNALARHKSQISHKINPNPRFTLSTTHSP